MKTWTKQKLGDIYKFQYGKGNANPSNGGKYPVYGAGNIIGYFDEYNAENSPVIGHMGANCGKVIFGKGKHFVTYNGIRALIKEGSDSLFGYYVLLSKDFGKSIRGAAQPFISYDLLNNVDIDLPDFSIQMRISSVLSAYDNLIENNEKRIKILEEMAQKLYAEWFVKFKFPGLENVKMVDSSLGKIPEGWEVKKIEDQIKRISSGIKFENKTVLESGKVPVLDQGKSGIIGYHNNEPGVVASFQKPIIVFANHTCYQNLILYPFSTIQNVLPFIPNDERSIYWLHWVTKDTISFHDYKGHWPEFIAKKILVPPSELTNSFGRLVKNYVDLKFELQKTNENLAKTRDLLIPQLVTGKRVLKN